MKKKEFRIRILYLISGLRVGGAEKMLLNLIKRLPRKKYEITLCSLSDANHFGKTFEDEGIVIKILYMKSLLDITKLLGLHSLLLKGKFHILHSVMYHADVIGRIIGKLYKIPVIISSERNTGNRKTKLHSIVYKITAPFSDMILCVSDSARRFLLEEEKVQGIPMKVIRNGVEKPDFPKGTKILVRKKFGLPINGQMLVTACRIDAQKGLTTLIKSLKIVFSLFPNAFWVLVGDIEDESHRRQMKYKREIISRVETLGIENSVHMVGHRKDVYEIFAASDIFVMSSLFEGIPNSVLEAMTLGVPCVATRVGGVPEIIKSGQTGLLVPAKDSKELAEATCSLLSDPEKARKLGNQGKQFVRSQMDWDVMAENVQSVYMTLLRRKEGKNSWRKSF